MYVIYIYIHIYIPMQIHGLVATWSQPPFVSWVPVPRRLVKEVELCLEETEMLETHSSYDGERILTHDGSMVLVNILTFGVYIPHI